MPSYVAPIYTAPAKMSAIEELIMAWGPPPAPEVSVQEYDPAKYLSLSLQEFQRVKDGVRVNLLPKQVNGLNARFRSKLARLTLQRLDLPWPTDSPSPAEELVNWDSITRAWVDQACFLPGDPEGWNLGMTTKHWLLQHVGRMIVYTVREIDNNGELLKRQLQHGPVDALDPKSEKKPFDVCVFLRIPHGAVDWEEFRVLARSGDPVQHPATPLQHLLHLIAIRCQAGNCPTAILSDGETSFLGSMKSQADDDGLLSSATLSGDLVPESRFPAVYLLLATISEHAPSLSNTPVRTLGALNCRAPEVYYSFKGFRDFDAYHLGHDQDYRGAFLQWKVQVLCDAFIRRLSEGDVVSLHRTEPVPRKLLPWRCSEAYKPVSLPDEIALSVCTTRRPRNPFLGPGFLEYNPVPISFEITARLTGAVERLHDGALGKWFNVYVGRLSGVPGLLCLKVFDERSFPVTAPGIKPSDVERYPDLLKNLRHGDSMLRAEESAYSRLEKYQGGLVPHFYGCVEVELPRGCIALGILTEYVEGVPIARLLSAVRSSWTHEEQVEIYSRMRRALRVLKAHRISDNDSPEIRFLFVPRLDHDAADRADAVDLVMNNFAFTKQPWVPKHIHPASHDVQGFAAMLELSDKMMAETGWLPEHRERYEF